MAAKLTRLTHKMVINCTW